jgi:VIT1/CCC1 family predicted Fe2+/Mn2+ transporter
MPHPPHVETHFTASEFVRDVVIGMADGLTVPFALAAGLSGADITTRIIVVAGLAEIAAGSIAMGLGGYLAARNDADHYDSELRREQREVEEIPEEEAREVLEVFENYGLTRQEAVPIVDSLRQRPKQWIDFMMRFELGLEAPDPKRAVRSASTIAGAYIAGGLIPLAPYMLMNTPYSALMASVIATLVALAIFGAIKGHYTGMSLAPSAFRTMVIGGLAAAAAFGIARLVSAK